MQSKNQTFAYRELNYHRDIERIMTSIKLTKKENFLVNKLLSKIALATPDQFFDTLVESIAEILQVNHVFIGEFLPQENKTATLSFWKDGEFVSKLTYSIKSTPCEQVIGKKTKVYANNLQKLFPKDQNLVQWQIESYLGMPLFNSKKEALGHIALLDTKPLQDIEVAKTVLKVCIRRIAAELERSINERFVRESEQQLRLAQEIGKIGSYYLNLETSQLTWSKEMKTIFGVSETPTQEQYWQFIHPSDTFKHKRDSRLLANEGQSFTSEIRIIKKDNTIAHLLTNGKAILNKDKKTVALIGTAQDITEQKLVEEKVRYLANYDSVTNLPNRRSLENFLQHSLALAKRQNTTFSLMYFDLNRFKDVNDTLGHHIGDKLLEQVSKRLANYLRESDVLARLGGDEFACILYDTPTKKAAKLAKRLLDKLDHPFHIQDYTVQIGASIGIASYPQNGLSCKELLKNADIAMYRAKEQRKSAYASFQEEDGKKVKERVFIEKALIAALRQEQFSLHYQPRFNLNNGTIDSLEALLRWQHPEHGYIPPTKFIPIAEETGLIHDLGKWVLNHTCYQQKLWQKQGLFIRVGVNLSAKELQRNDIAEQVHKALTSNKLNGNSLELEITESAAMSNQTSSFNTLAEIKKMGVHVAIDDFGTGFSSLSHLKRLPLDCLKIDKSFVSGINNQLKKDIGNKENIDIGIINMILNLAKSLNLITVAEGVENKAQHDFLQGCGCNSAQGFLYSKPLPAKQITELYSTGLAG